MIFFARLIIVTGIERKRFVVFYHYGVDHAQSEKMGTDEKAE